MLKNTEELIDILLEMLKNPENEYVEFKKAKNNLKKSLDKQNPIGYTGKHKRDLRKTEKANHFLQ